MLVVGGGEDVEEMVVCMMVVVCVMVVVCMVVVLKEEREGEGEWSRAMTRTVRRVPSTGPRPTRVLSLCAKLRRTYPTSLQVF